MDEWNSHPAKYIFLLCNRMLPPVSLRVVIKLTLRQIKPPRNPSFHWFRDTWPIPFSFLSFPLSLSLFSCVLRVTCTKYLTPDIFTDSTMSLPLEEERGGGEKKEERWNSQTIAGKFHFIRQKCWNPHTWTPLLPFLPSRWTARIRPLTVRARERKIEKSFFLFFFFFLAKVRKFSRRSYLIEGEGAVRLSVERRFDLFVSD